MMTARRAALIPTLALCPMITDTDAFFRHFSTAFPAASGKAET
jgi:hypothetical protein